jgi:hypothetical protein
MLLAGEEAGTDAMLARLLDEPGFTRAAAVFRETYNRASQTQIVEAIAARGLQLARTPTRVAI